MRETIGMNAAAENGQGGGMKQLYDPAVDIHPTHSYLPVVGSVQVFLGIVYILLSTLGWVQFASHEQVMDPESTGLATLDWLAHSVSLGPQGLVVLGLLLQLAFGWILGLFTIWAGVKSLNGESRRFVRRVAIANLFYIPIGSTIGAMLLIGLRRPSIRQAFHS